MLGLIKTPDHRYSGAPDPDEERERRWEPISRRISIPASLSLLAIIVSAQTPMAVSVLLNVTAIALCAYVVKVSWPRHEPDATGTESADDT